MSTATPAIRSVKARAVIAPIGRPVKNAFGVIEAAPLVLIDVETDQEVTGHSYIFAYTILTLKPLVHLVEEIGRDLIGRAVAPFDLMALMDAKSACSAGRAWSGWRCPASTWRSGMRWDRPPGQPLAQLLGGSPRPIRAL